MEKGLSIQMEQFYSNVRLAGEEVVFNTFPKKQLVQSTANTDSPFHDACLASIDTIVYPPPLEGSPGTDAPSKKRKILTDAPNGDKSPSPRIVQHDIQYARLSNLVLENKHVKRLHAIIKKECDELVDSMNKVRLWVTLAIPKIEDGDNFGWLYELSSILKLLISLLNSEAVEVQEEILNEIHRAQDCAYNLRDSARQNHLARAKICSKLIKYPFVEDYTSALLEHDEKQIFYARHHLRDIRDLYAALTDITQKNITKIRAPQSNNGSGIY
ncbi:proteasome activator pa28 REG alpha/beta subunit [Lentinula aciculospora]|uniref:Proteasome activator pa28 REG alpha/beta subunit n=1 Tax=Lentinula aciculospora TaxID=153920 RepID=A0A9W9AQC3_9AGAR|nr:proteasome activator pa28 REG alpha/beta subunit [Lentinula aciculospora]